jgi:hypothetical protein
MDPTLKEVLLAYTVEPDSLPNVLKRLTLNQIQAALSELVGMYANDVNSSTVREFVTLIVAGYEPRQKKLGANGFNAQTNVECDVKPDNIRSGQDKHLNGGGNFSDLTPERVDRYEQKAEGLHILASGFVDGHLIYVLEFPYRCIAQRIRKQVRK